MERSLAFYQELLGLRLLGRSPASARLSALDGAPLLILEACPGARMVPRRGSLGLYHVALLLPSRAALGQFLRHIGASGIHIGMSDHLFSEALYLTDPDGLGLEVYADRAREDWPRENGELVGASLPLDVAAVLEAAAPDPFAGIPAGSVIGHIHFYVDDLDRASSFYETAMGFEPMTTLPSARFVSAGGYHHHVAFNTWAVGAQLPKDDDARLLEWQLALPDSSSLAEAAQRLALAGFAVETLADGSFRAVDPWRSAVRVSTR